jgi:hypothetical protein
MLEEKPVIFQQDDLCLEAGDEGSSILRFELFEVIRLETGRKDRQELADLAGGAIETVKYRKDGVFDIIGDPGTVAGQDLVHIKRVATGDAVHVFAAIAAGFGEVLDRGFREWGELDPGKRMLRQLSQQLFQGMAGVDLLFAPGQDKQAAEAGDAASQEFDEVDRGFVRPMDVFEYEEGWTGLLVESLEEIGEEG